jgi:hypothetical protein
MSKLTMEQMNHLLNKHLHNALMENEATIILQGGPMDADLYEDQLADYDHRSNKYTHDLAMCDISNITEIEDKWILKANGIEADKTFKTAAQQHH